MRDQNSIIDPHPPLTIGSFLVAYSHRQSAEHTAHEIFIDRTYQFSTAKKAPFIIDAGSNIGLATLFFKTEYPQSEILCFEPDPRAFLKLQENISCNQIQNIDLVNAALSSTTGSIDFFGEIDGEEPDSRGNSTIPEWGLQRRSSLATSVACVPLSRYIDRDVDFLKLDIEGAEQSVLEELSRTNTIKYVREMSIEVHESDLIKHLNSLDFIVKILEKNNFRIKITKKNIQMLLPSAVNEWVKKTNPHLFQVHAILS